MGKNFHQSIPQVAAYSYMAEKNTGITKIFGIIFNEQGAYMFEPQSTLIEVEKFMIKYGIANRIIWNGYIY